MAKTSKTSTAKKTTTRRAAPKKSTAAAKTVVAEKVKVAPVTRSNARVFSKDNLNPSRLLAELFGTFVLTLVVVAALSGKLTLSLFATPDVLAQAAQTGQSVPGFSVLPWAAGFALAVLVLVTYRISGGQLNPAITAGMMALRRMKVVEGMGYILAQAFGAMLALVVATRFISVMNTQTGHMAALDPATLFSHAATWNVFTAELLGAAVFGFGVAAAATLPYRTAKALAIGSSFVLGAAVAMMAGAGVLNPAVAVGAGLVGFGDNVWPLVGIYLGGTTLGMVVGMALYTLLDRQAVEEA